jgi:hypothetical protein
MAHKCDINTTGFDTVKDLKKALQRSFARTRFAVFLDDTLDARRNTLVEVRGFLVRWNAGPMPSAVRKVVGNSRSIILARRH